MTDRSNPTELQDTHLVTSLLDTIKYVLGSELYDQLNEALRNYIDDITKISIDYSDVKDDLVRSKLENFNQMMIVASARNDFAEFCRCAGLKIESVLEYFIENYETTEEETSYHDYQSSYYGKYKKYDYWYNSYFNISEPRHKFYYIYNLLKIRDASSHQNLYTSDMIDNIRKVHHKNSDYSIQQIIRFYKEQNFNLVKDRSEWFVKTTLLYFKLL